MDTAVPRPNFEVHVFQFLTELIPYLAKLSQFLENLSFIRAVRPNAFSVNFRVSITHALKVRHETRKTMLTK